jgi:hypothetical protein
MFEPCDDTGERLAAFSVAIDRDGRIDGGATLTTGTWHTLEFQWDSSRCDLTLDGKPAGQLASHTPANDGLSYLRLRSTAPVKDAAGFLVESVSVRIR